MATIVLTLLICTLALPERCEPAVLLAEGPPLACLVAQPTIAGWLAQAKPGWRLQRIDACTVGQPA